MDAQQSKIVSYLAAYARIEPTPQFGQLDLRRDLRLEPLDLVLFGLDLERITSVPFPFEALYHVKTVGDLLLVVTQWLADEAHTSDVVGTSATARESKRPARYSTPHRDVHQ